MISILFFHHLCSTFLVCVYHDLPFSTVAPISIESLSRKVPKSLVALYTYSLPHLTCFLEFILAGWQPVPVISSPSSPVSFLPVSIKRYFPWLTNLWLSNNIQRKIINSLKLDTKWKIYELRVNIRFKLQYFCFFVSILMIIGLVETGVAIENATYSLPQQTSPIWF